MQKLYFIVLLLFSFSFLSAQKITGKVIDTKTQNPFFHASVAIQNTIFSTFTDKDGVFVFEKLPAGDYILKIYSGGYAEQLLPITVLENQDLDVGIIVLDENIEQQVQQNLVSLLENDLTDDNGGSENSTGLLQSTRDAFQQAVTFNFGQSRYNIRGIDNKYAAVLMNGISMNRFFDGRPQYSNWGGLNDAMRNQEFTTGSAISDYTFGNAGGSLNINTRASNYRASSRVSFLGTNTNYNFRTMATYASGMNANGWAFVVSAGRRWAKNGYFDGTNYDANSLFASVEKKLNDNHSLNFTAIYADNKHGKNSQNTQEVNDLLGVNYNSFWGYQNGEKRNSRVKQVQEPIFMVNHFWNVDSKTKITTSLSYQFGKIGNSRLDFQKTNSPDPVYTSNLPSYYLNQFNENVFTPKYADADKTKTQFLANPQINWENLYRINKENAVNGSRYVLYEDRTDDKIFTLNTILNTQLSENISLNAGASFVNSNAKNYKKLLDLLGGQFYNDINIYGKEIGQNQSDLNNPDRKVILGDKYGYYFNMYSSQFKVFTQFKFTYSKVDFYLSQTFSKTQYQREGFFKNGYYPNNSFGKSEIKNFDNFGFKAGLTYKISGYKFLDFNGLYMSNAPNNSSVFSNSRLNNSTVSNISSENVKSIDVSYIFKTPKIKTRITGYFNEIENATEVGYFFADGLQDGNNFVVETVTGLNKRNFGLELGLEYQFSATIKGTTALGIGNYTYTNDPNVLLAKDSDGTTTNYGKAKLSGYKIPGMPQQAFSIGLEYRDPKFWWISCNANYLSNNYLDIASLLRTENFVNASDDINFPFDQNLADKYLKQEKFNPYFLVNLLGGKSWKIKTKTLGFFVSINNLWNVKYKTGGYEQSRNASYSEVYKDSQSGTRSFGPKYFYGYGRTFSMSLYCNF